MKHARSIPLIVLAAMTSGMLCEPAGPADFNPFTDLPPLTFNGRSQPVTSEISRLGMHSAGQVLKITVTSDTARAAYILKPDSERSAAGVIIDGGPVNTPFFHRVAEDEELFLFLDAPPGSEAAVVLEFGPADFRKPPAQAVVVEFEENFLADGLFDPATNDEADLQFLISVSPGVGAGIIQRLREIFAGTKVGILGPDDDRPAEFSLITYKGHRQPASGEEFDSLQVDSRPGASACEEFVIFGEVLPRGQNVDPGNQDSNDKAVVYTGSFRSTGNCDPGFAVNSLNNIINALALSGAHEAGHLLGLNHTALDGLMAATPSFAFQRQIRFQRSQIALDVGNGLEVLTNVIQDPQEYLARIFSGDQ